MTKKEFCDRIGIHCSDACFEKYNERYNQSELDKDAFCATISANDISWEMQWEIIELKRQLEVMKQQRDESNRKYGDLLDENLNLTRKFNKIQNLINE